AYNVQVAVDAKHHLIVAHEVTNAGSDRTQLSPMAQAAREAMGKKRLRALADRGYFSGNQIKACADVGIAVVLPKPTTSNAKADGRFDKADFTYIKKDDEYECPAGQRATFRMVTEERGMMLRRYWSSACPKCPLKAQCTPSGYRRITRWEHEEVLEAVQRRLDQSPESMMIRRRTVEHVFGTLKSWMGYTHFLTRQLRHVGAEMSFNVLAYNFKRVLQILGFEGMMKAMRLARA
ncbi:transposase, partial [Rhodoferax saidenbachensis]